MSGRTFTAAELDSLERDVSSQADAIAFLRRELTAVQDALDYLHGLTPKQATALRWDAKRYRWLRDDACGRALSVSALCWETDTGKCDAAIDAAIVGRHSTP